VIADDQRIPSILQIMKHLLILCVKRDSDTHDVL
jgi:hypothetical protein